MKGCVKPYLSSMKMLYRFLYKNYGHLLTILGFTLLVSCVVYVFMYREVIPDKGKAVTIAISIVGILIAVFQFIFTQISNQKKKVFDLRYAFYKDIVKQVQLISDIIQEGMLRQVAPSDTIHKLMSAANDLTVAMEPHSDWLFPGLLHNDDSAKIGRDVEALVNRTHRYHASVANDDSQHNLFVEGLNWHNEIGALLGKLIADKPKYFALIRSYL